MGVGSIFLNPKFFIYLVYFVALIVSLPCHEFCHAYVAHLLGDDSAKKAGRLSLNPSRHFDLIGFFCLFFSGFGWAKPIPVNVRKFSNPKFGMALVGLVGPVSNLLLATMSLFLYKILVVLMTFKIKFFNFSFLAIFFNYFTILNINLAVFNMLPIPPLDGSRLLMCFLPSRQYNLVLFLEKFGFIFLVILMLSTNFDQTIIMLSSYVLKFLDTLTSSLEVFSDILIMG